VQQNESSDMLFLKISSENLRQANIYLSLLICMLVAGCYPKPKLYEGDAVQATESVGSTSSSSGMTGIDQTLSNEHTVIVEEVLDTDKYSYLFVSENGNKFWIAIPRKEIVIGGTYHYQGGLLKRNFESKEYNRVFETIYLVSDVDQQSVNSSLSSVPDAAGHVKTKQVPVNIVPVEGSVRLSNLFSNRAKYQGKVVMVTGKCVKVNPMIMGRNWVHIQDGSGNGLDLTITTAEHVHVDDVVSFEGLIALNKDFGAGYQYDIIMEQATLK